MLEHLDDPRAPEASDAQQLAVLWRARRIRRRRTRRLVPVAVLAVAALAVGLVQASGPTRVTSSETADQFNQIAGPLAPGTAVPTTTLARVVFATDSVGFGIALHRGRPLLVTTTDGGAAWTVQDPQLPGAYDLTGFIPQFEFTSPTHGYLWAGEGPLLITDDGGRSWQDSGLGTVADVSAIGADVWALVGPTCVWSPNQPESCSAAVAVSLDGGASWSSGPPEPAAAPDVNDEISYELARITTQRAYVLTVGSGISIAFTDDGGASWTARPVPCAGQFAFGAELAASGTDDLWLLCGGQGTAGYQPKALFRSSDGGASWTLAASAAGLGTRAGPPAGTDPLPVAGYVAPISSGHDNLAVASPTTAWLFPSRGPVYETTDGGVRWVPVPGLLAAGLGTGSPGNITFNSATEGWAVEQGAGLWQTTDGVTWTEIGAPPSIASPVSVTTAEGSGSAYRHS